jgi:SagB-type dehydrogenase family enzyme
VPRSIGTTSIERALLNRRSVREFSDEPLSLTEISQLLWAAQGVTDHEGLRSAPSAGALFPLELHLLSANVIGLADCVYSYLPEEHELLTTATGAYKKAMTHAAQDQDCVAGSAAILVFSAVFEKTKKKYGERGTMYVHMEVGHAVENVYLQAVALDLGTVVVGSFKDEEVMKVVQAARDCVPLALMPVGRRSGGGR